MKDKRSGAVFSRLVFSLRYACRTECRLFASRYGTCVVIDMVPVLFSVLLLLRGIPLGLKVFETPLPVSFCKSQG